MALCPGLSRTNSLAESVGVLLDQQRSYIEAERARSKHNADDIARIAREAVEKVKPYALPHAEIRWLWRAKRLAPGIFAWRAGTLDRRGHFSRS